MKLVALTSVALLVGIGCAVAQGTSNTMTSGRPSAVLTPDQCNAVWSKAVPSGDTLAQDAAPYIVNFAQVDTDNDGIIDKKEFDVLWEWPREKPTVIGSQTHVCLAAGHQKKPLKQRGDLASTRYLSRIGRETLPTQDRGGTDPPRCAAGK